MKKKRFLSIFLALIMMLCLSPVVSLTSIAATKENLNGSADRWFKPDLYFDTKESIVNFPLTIEAMIHLPTKAASNYGKQGILLSGYDDSENVRVKVGTNTTGRPYIWINGNSSYTYTFSKSWIWADSYNNVAFTIDPTNAKILLYKNGSLLESKDYSSSGVLPSGDLPTNLNWRIGGDLTEENEYYFRGAVQYIAFYNQVLTAEELVSNSTNKTWDATKPLIAVWDLSRQIGTGSALKDQSGNGNDLTYTNESGMKIDTFGTYTLDKTLSDMPETVEAWLFMPLTYATRGGTFFGNWDAKGSTQDFAFEIYGSSSTQGTPAFFYNNADGNRESIYFNNCSVKSGEWVHLVIVHDPTATIETTDESTGETITTTGASYCYINGELSETKTTCSVDVYDSNGNTTESLSAQPITTYNTGIISKIPAFGADLQAGLRQRYNGFIKELRVYSDVRTADEIASDYTGTTDYTDENFILHYNLTPECEENNFEDLTGNGHDVTYTQDWWDYDSVDHVEEYKYSFAIVGDTQQVVYQDSNNSTTKVNAIYDWIVNNKEDKNIQFVFGVGDITEKDTDNEWTIAKNAITKMDGVVPYSLIRGQGHDTVPQFDKYFASHEGYTSSLAGQFTSGSVADTYQTITVGETPYLIMNLDMGGTDEVIAWANEIISAHPDHRVIITTHTYLKADGTYLVGADKNAASDYDSKFNNGDELWDKLVSRHPNICMVLCGHAPASEIVVKENTGIYGNTVKEILVDPQTMDSSSPTGMVAMLYFSEDGTDVTAEYYATITDRWKPTKTIEMTYGSTTKDAYASLSEDYLIAYNSVDERYIAIENTYFTFSGNSLRYEDASETTPANLRFKYAFDESFVLSNWYWNYGVAGNDLASSKTGRIKSEDNVTSLVITGIPTDYYTTDIEVQLFFTVSIDGVTYTVQDQVRTSSVEDVATDIVTNSEDLEYKSYAQSILSIINN